MWHEIQHDHGEVVIQDIHAIRAAYPKNSIQMGCGNPRWWFLCWYRPELRSRAPVDFIDTTAWMDMQVAGRTFPSSTLDTLRKQKFDVWLIPKFSQPFAQTSYYPPYGELFTPEFREAFGSGYRLAARSRCFDIYLARRLQDSPSVSAR
jgi:hypothetical protein